MFEKNFTKLLDDERNIEHKKNQRNYSNLQDKKA